MSAMPAMIDACKQNSSNRTQGPNSRKSGAGVHRCHGMSAYLNSSNAWSGRCEEAWASLGPARSGCGCAAVAEAGTAAASARRAAPTRTLSSRRSCCWAAAGGGAWGRKARRRNGRRGRWCCDLAGSCPRPCYPAGSYSFKAHARELGSLSIRTGATSPRLDAARTGFGEAAGNRSRLCFTARTMEKESSGITP